MRFAALCFLLCLTSTVFADPSPKDTEFVKVATSENFKQLVMEADKDVFIDFYAPWCGYCNKLAPTYEKLAEKLADEDILIVKYDADAHGVPAEFVVHGYPTLYLVPKNSKDSPLVYKGGRDVNDFIKFIAKHSTDGLKNYDRDGKSLLEEQPEEKENEAVVDKEPRVVKDVVTDNFKELVLDVEKDVLILFHAPWCPHCKYFDSIYETLARQLINEDVVVVQIDATANKIQSPFEVYSVPTLFFLPKNAKQTPAMYGGNRDLNDVIKFVASHSTDGLKDYDRNGEAKPMEAVIEPLAVVQNIVASAKEVLFSTENDEL